MTGGGPDNAAHPSQLPHHQNGDDSELVSGIVGAEELTWEELASEIKHGGRLVIFQYCVSIGILTFLQPSKIHLVRVHESTAGKGFRYTLLSLFAGWWGIPWGFIYTPTAIVTNISGGKDVTKLVFPNTR